MNIKNKSQLSRTMFLGKYGSLALFDEDLKKIFIIDHEELQLDKILAGLKYEFLKKLTGHCLIMSIFAFMMIYLIEFNRLIRIRISH